jgi:hypothetical protein
MDIGGSPQEVATEPSREVSVHVFQHPTWRIAEDGISVEAVPLSELLSGPSCGDPSCSRKNILVKGHLTEDGRDRARQAVQAGVEGFTPKGAITMQAATILIDPDRFTLIASDKGLAMEQPGHASHADDYRWVTATAESHGSDGALIATGPDDRILLMAFTHAIGQTVLIEDEHLEELEPQGLTRPPQPGSTILPGSNRPTKSGVFRFFGLRMIGPLVTAAIAYLLKRLGLT